MISKSKFLLIVCFEVIITINMFSQRNTDVINQNTKITQRLTVNGKATLDSANLKKAYINDTTLESYIKKYQNKTLSASLELYTSDNVYLYQSRINSSAQTVKIVCKINRAVNSDTIIKIALNGVTKTLPAIYTNKVVYDTLSVSLYNKTGNTYETQIYRVTLFSLNGDSVYSTINLNLGSVVYVKAYDLVDYNTTYDPFVFTDGTAIALDNGTFSLSNFNPNSYNILIAIPKSYSAKVIKFNGIIYKLPTLSISYYNIGLNGFYTTYNCYYTNFKIKQPIKLIELE
jgi:hypothetical protein